MNNPAFSLPEGPNDTWGVESLFGDELVANADLKVKSGEDSPAKLCAFLEAE